MTTKKRFVITGIGIISDIGIGKEKFWHGLKYGTSGIGPITLFDTSLLPIKVGGEITDFNAKVFLGKKGLRLLDRSTLLASTAAILAIDDAGLLDNKEALNQTGIVLGTTMGGLQSIVDFEIEAITEGPRYVNPALFPNTVFNALASQIAIRFLLKGPNVTISTGFSASLDAIDYVIDSIRLGRVDRMLVGGVEEMCLPMFLSFCQAGLLAKAENGDIYNCPFDKRRNGFIFAEGAALIVVEELNTALQRGATIYLEIFPTGSGMDSFDYTNQGGEQGRAIQLAMQKALGNSETKPEDIDFICAHANSSPKSDIVETNAIKNVFGNHAKNLSVCGIKSMIGETYSASGAFGVAAAIGTIVQGFLPPTINYEQPDSECDLDYVPNVFRDARMKAGMVNTIGSGGSCTSVVVKHLKND